MMDYNKIPDGVKKEELDLYLSDFLKNKERIIAEKNIMYALKKLGRIAEKYSYYKLDDDNELSDFLIKNIDFNNKEQIDLISYITVNMSLIRVINYMKDNKNKSSKEIKKIIKETEREMHTNEISEELNSLSSALLSEMKKNKFSGTYEIIGNDHIKWKIQENVTIMILLCASGAGSDDVICFHYNDANGKEYIDTKCDVYPHNNIMELLCKYNDCKYEITEKGLFRKKYKLNIFF